MTARGRVVRLARGVAGLVAGMAGRGGAERGVAGRGVAGRGGAGRGPAAGMRLPGRGPAAWRLSARWLAGLAVLAAGLLGGPHAARAQVSALVSCSAAGPTLTFGTVNPYGGFPVTTSGGVLLSCTNTGVTATTVYACVSVGTGSGGISASNRALASGGSTLPIQITGGSGSPGQVGTGSAYPMEGPVQLTVGAGGSASLSIPLVATIPAPGSAPPPGTYMSAFSGADAQLLYSTPVLLGLLPPTTCTGLLGASHATVQANFSINATVPTQCTVVAGSLAFPTAAVLDHSVSATATISTTCNAATPVTVALDNGATGSGPTTRQMRSGANVVTYGIYRDAGATMPWGTAMGTTASIAAGTGTVNAYGLVPAQASPAPGTYSDVVNVIVTY